MSWSWQHLFWPTIISCVIIFGIRFFLNRTKKRPPRIPGKPFVNSTSLLRLRCRRTGAVFLS